ncbi:UNVERIFIED_ORG: hypothetical protein J2W85_005739 [Ensifer adhaerens]|nr:hypothetical protein [Ensifer adhaerens]
MDIVDGSTSTTDMKNVGQDRILEKPANLKFGDQVRS